MDLKGTVKKILSAVGACIAFLAFGMNAFSIVDYSAGESGLISDETTKYKVNMLDADGKNIAVVPVGIGVRGDADGSGSTDLQDAIIIAKYLVGGGEKDFEGSFGYIMSDGNLDKKVDLRDAINVAKYLVTQGSHEERWQKILGNNK